MTVSATSNRVSYNGDGVTVEFPFTFKVFEESDIKVLFRDIYGVEGSLTLDTDYTLELSDVVGGTLTYITSELISAPAVGTRITIYRDIDYTQEIDLVQNDPQNADVLEEGIDRAVILAQQLRDAITRTLLLPVSSSYADLTLPDPVPTYYLRWNEAGDALENMAVLASGDLSVSPFIETLLDDADAATARATLQITLTTLGLDTDLATFSVPAGTTISAYIKTLLDDADAATARTTLEVMSAADVTAALASKGKLYFLGTM